MIVLICGLLLLIVFLVCLPMFMNDPPLKRDDVQNAVTRPAIDDRRLFEEVSGKKQLEFFDSLNKPDVTVGVWVDVLKKMSSPEGLTLKPELSIDKPHLISLPERPQGSFELELNARSTNPSFSCGFSVVLPVGGEGTRLVLGALGNGAGLEIINGRDYNQNATSTMRSLAGDKEHRFRIRVLQLPRQYARIDVYLDQEVEPFISCIEPMKVFSLPEEWQMAHPRDIGLAGGEHEVRITRLQMRPLKVVSKTSGE